VLSLLHQDLQQAREEYAKMLIRSSQIKSRYQLTARNIKAELGVKVSFFRNILKSHDKSECPLDLPRKKRIKTPEDHRARKYLVEQLLANDWAQDEVAAKLNISRSTFFRIKAKSI
jgi:predicted DNA-binding protein (UPF0251 family)